MTSLPSIRAVRAHRLLACRARRAGFTMAEILTVIAIISILAMMTGAALLKARELARRTRAEAELRSIMEACLQYHAAYEEWPGSGTDFQDVGGALLSALTGENSHDLVFLNLSLVGESFKDPWGRAYEVKFGGGSDDIEVEYALRSTVDFINRYRQFPY